jgi:hypothetical protein
MDKGGEKMKREQKMILGVVLILAMFSSSAVLMPVSAKTNHLPAGADRVDYIDGGGTVDIALTVPLPTNYPQSATIMRLKFMHAEKSIVQDLPQIRDCHEISERECRHKSKADLSFDTLLVFFYMKITGATEYTWQPFAVITTSQEYATFCETFWRGSLVKWNVPPPPPVYPPTAVGTNNVKFVSDEVLSVERHGNCVKVNLNVEQQLMRPVTGNIFTLPSFSLKLNKVGCLSPYLETGTMTGYADASGYTYKFDTMGFNANAVFSSSGTLITGATSNAAVVMHGTHTFFPST